MPIVVPRLAVSIGIWRGDQVLLIRRARPPLAGLWTFPGGHVEAGETVAEAIRREAAEETGLTVDPVGEPLLHEIILRDPTGAVASHHVLLVHAAIAPDGTEPVAGSDAAAAQFLRPDQLGALETTPRLAHFIAETARRLSLPSP